MFMAILGLLMCVYLTHFHGHNSRITHIEPALSHSSIDDKSILSNSVRKPYDIRLKKSLSRQRTIYTRKQAQASLIRNHRTKQCHIRPEDVKPSDTENGDRVKT